MVAKNQLASPEFAPVPDFLFRTSRESASIPVTSSKESVTDSLRTAVNYYNAKHTETLLQHGRRINQTSEKERGYMPRKYCMATTRFQILASKLELVAFRTLDTLHKSVKADGVLKTRVDTESKLNV